MNEPLKGKFMRSLINGFESEDVKSAVEGMYDEFTRNIMVTSDLDPINIVRHFGDLQMKWFADAIDNDTKERL